MSVSQRSWPFALAASLALAPGAAAQQPAGDARSALEIACGPEAVTAAPAAAMRIVTGHAAGRTLFGPGDLVVLDAGSAHGLQPGQEFFARRAVADRFIEVPRGQDPVTSIRTAGWIRLEEVGASASTARVVHACDALGIGDFLEPFILPTVPTAVLGGQPDFGDPAYVLLGAERRHMGAASTLMVLGRGSDQGIMPGLRLTIFRPSIEEGPVQRIGEATVMTVSPKTSLIRVETARDAVFVGDRVAIHK